MRGLDSVLLDVDPGTGAATERWSSSEFAGSALFMQGAPLGDGAVLPLQSHDRPPSLVAVEAGALRPVVETAHEGTDVMRAAIGERRAVSWEAPDGQTIEGILTLPHGEPPFPLLVQVHGGPVWGFQDFFPSALRALEYDRGYATLEPNPRGSWGRGREFVEAVVGDMGGADTADILAGVDHVIGLGLADPARIGVTGGSYGGYMACWLPVVDGRFAAAVAVSPVTDWFSERFESNLGSWAVQFLGGDVARAPAALPRPEPRLRRRPAAHADPAHRRREGPRHPVRPGRRVPPGPEGAGRPDGGRSLPARGPRRPRPAGGHRRRRARPRLVRAVPAAGSPGCLRRTPRRRTASRSPTPRGSGSSSAS